MKIYFASDLHLIAGNKESLHREKAFVQWLDMVKHDADAVYLLGDMFDFWFEYKTVAPRGFTRFIGKLCELTDSGIPVHFFTGNHDLWARDYLASETGVTIHTKPLETEVNGLRFLIGHGHGLGDKHSYQLLLKIFGNRTLHFLYAAIHPRWGMAFWQKMSGYSFRKRQDIAPLVSTESECLVRFARQELSRKHYDYFVFGHRHVPMKIQLAPDSFYINTGEWITSRTYAVFDGENMELHGYIR
jgi:UDP-2,3-diacylglucosamine hydrolase